MKIDVIRGRDGQLVGAVEADEVQSPEGTVAGWFEPEEGQEIETIEVRRSETFDLDGLIKRLERKKK